MTDRYLLDTNILSESRRKNPNPGPIAFLLRTDPSLLHVSVLTIGELRKGLELKRRTDPAAAQHLEPWVDGIELNFSGQILGVDAAIARLWGSWSASRPRPVVDTLLAATAHLYNLVLVTRNTTDVADLPVQIHNPWS